MVEFIVMAQTHAKYYGGGWNNFSNKQTNKKISIQVKSLVILISNNLSCGLCYGY